jgi:hypothetical protein
MSISGACPVGDCTGTLENYAVRMWGRPPFRSPYALSPVRLFAAAGLLARFSGLRLCPSLLELDFIGLFIELSFQRIESFRLTVCVGEEP